MLKKNDEEKASSFGDLAAIKESIDKNTEALDKMGKAIFASILAASNRDCSFVSGEAANVAYHYNQI